MVVMHELGCCGIIPAGAGLTVPSTLNGTYSGDHPRGCGAHYVYGLHFLHGLGSSPRVRGSLAIIIVGNSPVGIIPAGAGLTFSASRRSLRNRDHPRGCGAHAFLTARKKFSEGSSPRVRGSQSNDRTTDPSMGIIPAGAGLTSMALRRQKWRRDHPRGCGAHMIGRPRIIWKRGSSPRVRGSHAELLQPLDAEGIIPAGAGLTGWIRASGSFGRDHPRGCGAHCSRLHRHHLCLGSSPRVRGSH